MKFFRLFVNNKVVIYIFTFIIVLAGISAYVSLPRESSPSIEIPYVFISTVYVGVSPEEIEKLVTMEIEKQVKASRISRKLHLYQGKVFHLLQLNLTRTLKLMMRFRK